MARPRKQTVDYFPHMVNHGKTMYILEQKYGNDGYAFWFKLLEMLGATKGHYLHLENGPDWEFLQAKTHIEGDKCGEILDLLSKLGAIDKELWKDHKIVWADNFINNISEVYNNRRVGIPPKPSFYNQKPLQGEVSTDRKPQSKVKDSKVNETKVNNDDDAPEIVEDEKPKTTFAQVLESEFGRFPSPMEVAELNNYIKGGIDEGVVCEAIRRARAHGSPKLSYTMGILNNWKAENIATMAGVQLADEQHQKRKPKQRAPDKDKPPKGPKKDDKFKDLYVT